ncbi:MAG: UMP kinase [Thermoplasmata archaeon]|nr:MAG: UMP kinase [Thermoplasmata archaeon]HEC89211.1 UMP kinase [Thermoplasmatales archaeon]
MPIYLLFGNANKTSLVIDILAMEAIVISLGGSVVFSHSDPGFMKKLARLLEALSDKYKIYIVIGGGKIAREYIKLGRELGIKEKLLDEIGISITRVNARFFSSLVSNVNRDIPTSTDEAINLDEPIVIMGGTTPGHSTDQVGAELAFKSKASRFIIATNVDGIYDKDPNVYKDAKHLSHVYIENLIDQYGTAWNEAGKNIVIDGPALQTIYENRIKTFVVNGRNLVELEKAIDGKPFYGTKILFKK